MRARIVVLIAPVLVGACALTTNLGDLGGADGSSDAASDVASSDGGGGEASNDAGVSCTDNTVLIGSSDIGSMIQDYVAATGLDVFRMFAQSAGVARCAWIYVDAPNPAVTVVYVATYSLDDAGAPSKLLATAKIDNPIPGWNTAALDTPITLASSESLWVGPLSPAGDLHVRDTESGCGFPMQEDIPLAVPPSTFSSKKTYPTCAMGLFLAP